MLHCYCQRKSVNKNKKSNKKNTPQSQNPASGHHRPLLGYNSDYCKIRLRMEQYHTAGSNIASGALSLLAPSSLFGCMTIVPEISQNVNSSLCNTCLQLYHFTTEINT